MYRWGPYLSTRRSDMPWIMYLALLVRGSDWLSRLAKYDLALPVYARRLTVFVEAWSCD